MPRLTDTHLIILSSAAQRADGLVLPVPDTVRASPEKVQKILHQLLNAGLIGEQPLQLGQDTWREAEEGGRFTLMLTDAGKAQLAASETMVKGDETEANVPSSKHAATVASRAQQSKGASASAPTKKSTANEKGRSARPATQPVEPPAAGKIGTLVKLFSRKSGATIEEAIKATGWQAHSIRGAISGALKKKHRFNVASEASDTRGRVYRIVR